MCRQRQGLVQGWAVLGGEPVQEGAAPGQCWEEGGSGAEGPWAGDGDGARGAPAAVPQLLCPALAPASVGVGMSAW